MLLSSLLTAFLAVNASSTLSKAKGPEAAKSISGLRPLPSSCVPPPPPIPPIIPSCPQEITIQANAITQLPSCAKLQPIFAANSDYILTVAQSGKRAFTFAKTPTRGSNFSDWQLVQLKDDIEELAVSQNAHLVAVRYFGSLAAVYVLDDLENPYSVFFAGYRRGMRSLLVGREVIVGTAEPDRLQIRWICNGDLVGKETTFYAGATRCDDHKQFYDVDLLVAYTRIVCTTPDNKPVFEGYLVDPAATALYGVGEIPVDLNPDLGAITSVITSGHSAAFITNIAIQPVYLPVIPLDSDSIDKEPEVVKFDVIPRENLAGVFLDNTSAPSQIVVIQMKAEGLNFVVRRDAIDVETGVATTTRYTLSRHIRPNLSYEQCVNPCDASANGACSEAFWSTALANGSEVIVSRFIKGIEGLGAVLQLGQAFFFPLVAAP